MDEKVEVMDKLLEKVEKALESALNNDIQASNVEYIYKLVDIHKDIYEEKYYKKEGKDMYRGYEGYSEGYGRRGVPGSGRGRYRRYRGDDIMEEMQEHYGRYMEGRGYGSQEEDKSFRYMIKTYKDFGMHIAEEANTQEQREMLKRATDEICRNV